MKPEADKRRVVVGGLLAALFALAPAARAESPARLACAPLAFQTVPGEPLRLELTVEADSAAPVRLHIPAHPLLHLRAVEKLPVQRTKEGLFVHKRVVLWQALEPGSAKIDAISVDTPGGKQSFPAVTITVSDPGT